MKTWIAFTNRTGLKWLRVFKKGFRHCFVVAHDGYGWITLDPLAGGIYLDAHRTVPIGFDMIAWLEGQGCTVCFAGECGVIPRQAPIAFLTCVGVCKRAIGLHRVGILTPWQLYKHLKG